MRGKSIFKRLTATFTALLMAFSAVPGFSFVSAADTPSITTVSDLSTINGWETFFGDDKGTENAGGIWVDKSVFDNTDLSELTEGLNETDAQKISLTDENNFIVALSALASTKSITGYSYIPTDTVLVLDVSGSMFQNISSDDAADNSRAAKMVEAANSAIRILLANNNHNRVAVVLYSTTGVTFLPLDRYTVASETDDYLTFTWTKTQQGGNGGDRPGRPGRPGDDEDEEITYVYSATISTGSTLRDSNGDLVEESRAVSGGTYIQLGMDMAGDILANVDDVTVEGGAFQAGVDKMPIIVLMSDGAPTYGTASFTDVTTNNRSGNGSNSNANLAFATQLTGAYTKYRVEQNYNRNALIYTLGVGVSGDEDAINTLNPAESSDNVMDLWETYDNLRANGSMSISFSDNTAEQTLRKNANVTSADHVYVDRYFSANTTSDISTAFSNIVDQIIIQSKYYPTYVSDGDHHLDGDITFDDDIGRYMEVKSMKGIVLGSTLFSGEALAHSINEGDLGIITSPTPLGNELVRSVKTRLGVDTETAHDLITLAYNSNQLYYDAATGEYSNYIGWYGDEDGNYLGFWDGDVSSTPPEGAVFRNKSYGYIGASGTGTSASNMMYIGIRVQTRITTGFSQVILQIPAALIPLITYEVSLDGTSYENATNIEVNKIMADPIRLIYEVGLRSDINELTVKDIVTDYPSNYISDSGIYSFYTNRWDYDQHIHEDHHPEEHINTVAFYTPSEENERYYYTEDTLIYTDKDLDSVYMGTSAPPAGRTYYRAYYVFSNTPNKDGIEATFVEISAESLTQAQRNEDNTWYIPRGVIHTTRGNFYVSKTTNPTGTYGFVREPVVGNYNNTFYATAFLGNNGLLTLDPAQGIKITKTIETVVPNTNTEFTFTVKNITNTSDNGEYRLIKQAADGTYAPEQAIYFTGGEATLTLNNGESAYIVDLKEGDTFTVEEVKHDDYRVKKVLVENEAISSIVASLPVSKDNITDAEFINAYIGKGLLVISKSVAHELGDDYTVPSNITFDVEVSLGADNAGKEFDTMIENSDGTISNGTVRTDSSGKFTLTVSDGTVIAIYDIPEDTQYTVTEADYSAAGFTTTVNGVSGRSASGTIVEDENSEVAFVNAYVPASADTSVLVHTGTKTISGREWIEGDEFEFVIERFDGSNYIEEARVSTKYADAVNEVAAFSFNQYLSSAEFDTPGKHLFRIREVSGEIGGVTYSSALYDITVTVSDDDMNGKLEITNVESSSATVIYSRNNGTWEIATPFENVYKASGSATIKIEVRKSIDDLTEQAQNLSLEGYQFGMYSTSGQLLATLVTDENGVATAERSYTAADIGTEFKYTLREINTGVTGIKYSDAVHYFTVKIVDNLDGTVGATVTSETNESTSDLTLLVGFENVYEPVGTSIILEGSKSLEGIRDMVAGEFNFAVSVTENGEEVATGSHDASGNITFTEIKYDYSDIGKHTYTITEVYDENADNGVTYDTSSKTVVVNVVDNAGKLEATIVSAESDSITFTNEYEAKDAEITINATKHLTGRELKEGEFTFKVTDEDGNEVTTATNNADGSITFSFTEDELGTHTYTIVEVDPNEDDGVTYDPVPRTVTVLVEDNGKGQLVASFVGGQPNIVFANSYTADGTTITLTGTKSLVGRDMKSGEFKFEVIDENGAVVSEGFNNANGNIFFSPINLDEKGTFIYTVYEVNNGLGGIDYSEARFTVVVSVTDDGKGNLLAEIVEDEIVFTNTYSAAATSIILKGTKSLTGRNMVTDEFTFSVTENGKVVATGKNDALGTITFTEIEYPEAGEHIYTITEDNNGKGGVTYDTDTVTVKVVVTDDGNGQLHAAIDYANSGLISFQNEYSIVTNATITLEGTKVLEGRKLAAGGFRFRLIGSDGTDTVLSHDASGKLLFTEFTYSKTGTYTYTISEINDGMGGITYDDTVYTVKVEVTDNGDGTLSAAVTDDSPEVIFTNYYEAEGTSIILEGSKTLTGIRDMIDGEFEFIVTENGEEVSRGKNDIRGKIVFDEIQYTEEGEHTYIISEVDGGNGGITYDTSTKTVIVKVTDNGIGKLVATVDDSSDDIVFVNSYSSDAATVKIDATKNITGRSMTDGEFTFIVTQNGVTVATATNNADGVIEFEFTTDKVGTHTYVVSEQNGGELGMTYDNAVFTVIVNVTDDGNGQLDAEIISGGEGIAFNNTYVEPELVPVDVTINGHKTLNAEDRELKALEFTFVLYTADGEYVTGADNLANGDFTIEFEIAEEGTFEYILTEDSSSNERGMTYDDSEYKIVVVTAKNDNYELYIVSQTITKNGVDAEVEFLNTYVKPDTHAPIMVYKYLQGRDLVDGEFSFEIYEANEQFEKISDLPYRSATNDADGIVDFGNLTFSEAGTYRYIVSEVKGGLSNVVYDSSEYRITVVVTEDETTGMLNYDITYADDRGNTVERVLFKNNFKGGTPGAIINEKLRMTVLKQMVDLTDSGYNEVDGFMFKVTEITSGKEYTAISNAAGYATFEIEYTAADIGKTYIYEITEVNTGVAGVTYDETVHTVVVKIGYIPTIGKVSVYATKDGVLLKDEAAVFVNKYNLVVEDPVEACLEVRE